MGSHLSRRDFARAAAGAGFAAGFWPLSRVVGAESAEEINVVLIVCDALRADRLGCYGYKREFPSGRQLVTTNFIDGLAKEGVLYENCIAQSSWTQTSMVSMLHSAWPVIKGSQHCYAYVREETKAVRSSSPGMKRVAFQANPYLNESFFTSRWDYHQYAAAKDYASAKLMNDEFDWEVGDLAREKKPFFAYLHYMEPHEPYTHQHQFRGTFTRKDWNYFHPLALCGRVSDYHDDTGKVISEIPAEHMAAIEGMGDAYDEDVLYLDVQINALFELMRGYKILDRTFVIITSDHGQSFGEHGWCGHKQSLYQEEIHIPLLILGPGLPKGERVATQVRGVDIMPTIAALSGVSVAGLSGGPLLPVKRVVAGGNRAAYSCCDYAKFGDVLRLLTCLVTRERMKYIRILTQGRVLLREELYDLKADPSEKTDLAAERTDLVKEISGRMDGLEKKNYWKWATRREKKMDEETKKQLESLGYATE
ncbi:MAG: sulfatase-like hydrolase/transferase [Planctomycetota bacterium]|jgi:arylsulfatase A-like enzyme